MEPIKRAISEFRDFLEHPPKDFLAWGKLVVSVLIFSLLWVYISGFLVNWVAPGGSLMKHLNIWLYFLVAAGSEEIVFRWFPLMLLMIFFREKPVGLMVFVAFLSSIFFGLAHVSNYPPELGYSGAVFCSLLLQGWLGFIWSLVFIKCCRKADLFQILPIVTTTLIHCSYNMAIVYATTYF